MTYPHVRIEVPRSYNRSTGEKVYGAKKIATDDRIFAIAADGTEVDISPIVRGWSTEVKYGEIVSLKLEILAFELERPESRVEQATAAPGELR